MTSNERSNEILTVFKENRNYIKLFKEFKQQMPAVIDSYEHLDVVIKDESDSEMLIECLGTAVKVKYLVSIDKKGRRYGRIRFRHHVGEDVEVVMELYFDKHGSISVGFPGDNSELAINDGGCQAQILLMMLDKLLQTKYFKAAERLYP